MKANIKIIGLAALISFWAMLGTHAYQAWLSHQLGVSKLSPWLMALLWGNSTAFIGIALSRRERDWYMISSRVPSVLLCSLSVIQAWRPTIPLSTLVLVPAFNACCLGGVVWASVSEKAVRYLQLVSLFVFVTGYSVGMLLQLWTIVSKGPHGASLIYWGGVLSTSLIWIWYMWLRKERLLAGFFAFGSAILAVITIRVAMG